MHGHSNNYFWMDLRSAGSQLEIISICPTSDKFFSYHRLTSHCNAKHHVVEPFRIAQGKEGRNAKFERWNHLDPKELAYQKLGIVYNESVFGHTVPSWFHVP